MVTTGATGLSRGPSSRALIRDRSSCTGWRTNWVIDSPLGTRCEALRGGFIAHRRTKGEEGVVKGTCVAEKASVHRTPRPNRMSKLAWSWGDGVYSGRRASGEMVVGARSGGWRARTVQSGPQIGRWAADAAEMVGGVLWHTSEENEDADGPSVKAQLGERMRVDERTAAANPVPCRMNLTKADLEKYGFTAGRSGCRAWLTGRSRQGHSEECRCRFEKEEGRAQADCAEGAGERVLGNRAAQRGQLVEEAQGHARRGDGQGRRRAGESIQTESGEKGRARSRAQERRRRRRRARRRHRAQRLGRAPPCRVEVSPSALARALRSGKSGRRACRRASSGGPRSTSIRSKRRRCGCKAWDGRCGRALLLEGQLQEQSEIANWYWV